MGETLHFFDLLYGSKPADLYLLIWQKLDQSNGKPFKYSSWFTSIQEAAKYCEEAAINTNTYFGLGLSEEDNGPYKRVEANEVAAIPGVWLDIDIAGQNHKKTNLPRDCAEASRLLNEVSLAPSIVVFTGGGIQAYWRFNQLWQLHDGRDRHEAKTLVERWNEMYNQIAAKSGYSVDSTFDLARVFRVPGTKNMKKVEAGLAEVGEDIYILEETNRAYTPEELTAYLDRMNIHAKPALRLVKGQEARGGLRALNAGGGIVDSTPYGEEEEAAALDFELKIDANPNFELFQDLFESSSKFRRSWQHKRQEWQDQTDSSYDYSLVLMALNAGWPLQEVVNLIIAHRRRFGSIDKAMRADYIERTLKRARATLEAEGQASEEEEENLLVISLATGAPPPPGEEPIEDKRAEVLQTLSARLNIPLTRIIKIMGDPIVFRLETTRGNINMGQGSALLNPNTFRNAVFTACSIPIPRYTPAKWDKLIVPLLSQAIEEVAPDVTETPRGFTEFWLRKYLEAHRLAESAEEAVSETLPFRDTHTGGKYFFLQHFTAWLRLHKVGLPSYSQPLRDIGAVNQIKAIKVNGTYTTRSVWRLPEEL